MSLICKLKKEAERAGFANNVLNNINDIDDFYLELRLKDKQPLIEKISNSEFKDIIKTLISTISSNYVKIFFSFINNLFIKRSFFYTEEHHVKLSYDSEHVAFFSVDITSDFIMQSGYSYPQMKGALFCIRIGNFFVPRNFLESELKEIKKEFEHEDKFYISFLEQIIWQLIKNIKYDYVRFAGESIEIKVRAYFSLGPYPWKSVKVVFEEYDWGKSTKEFRKQFVKKYLFFKDLEAKADKSLSNIGIKLSSFKVDEIRKHIIHKFAKNFLVMCAKENGLESLFLSLFRKLKYELANEIDIFLKIPLNDNRKEIVNIPSVNTSLALKYIIFEVIPAISCDFNFLKNKVFPILEKDSSVKLDKVHNKKYIIHLKKHVGGTENFSPLWEVECREEYGFRITEAKIYNADFLEKDNLERIMSILSLYELFKMLGINKMLANILKVDFIAPHKG